MRFHALGVLDLRGARGEELRAVLVQPKRLALLAYLALANPPRLHRRDALFALFWPESDAEQARRSLRQSLYFLRQAVGSHVLVSRGDEEVGVQSDALWCDVREFERALDEGRVEDALALYQGSLLEGFHASGVAAEFDQWLEDERARLRSRAVAAAAGLRDAAVNTGNLALAIKEARHALHIDPGSEANLRQLLELLEKAGDRAAALRAYDEFTKRLQAELGVQPSPETVALIERLTKEPPPGTPLPAPPRSLTWSTSESTRGAAAPFAGIGFSPRRFVRRRMAVVVGVAVAVLAVIGVFAAGLQRIIRAPQAGATSDARLLAVLPFENVGVSGDAVFAEGIADEIRGKLAALPGLRVIASASTHEYKGASKRLDEIAGELGVRYLLTGKLLWQDDSSGVRRVRVSPELIEARSGTVVWHRSYDARLWDVFQVQSQIAQHVADALGIEVRANAERNLAAKPTASVPAFEAYLRGRDALLASTGFSGVRQAIEHFETAIRLDSTFALAWAWLAEARLRDIRIAVGQGEDSATRAIRFAAEQARRFAPNLPEAHLALGDYYSAILLDYPRAIEEYALGLVASPNSAELLSGLADVEQGRGEWERSMEHLRRAVELDPRSATSLMRLHRAYLWLRRYPEALEIAERAIAVRPQHAYPRHAKAMVYLAQGKLDSAHAVLKAAELQVGTAAIVTYMALNWDLSWALPESQEQWLLRSTPADFDDDTVAYWFAMEDIYHARGHVARAKTYAESTLAVIQRTVRGGSPDPQNHIKLGIALALLGRKGDAVREGKIAAAMVPLDRDAYLGAYALHQLARIETLAGAADSAIAHLDALLRIPYFVSRAWLRVDPTWDALRGHSTFQRLVAVP